MRPIGRIAFILIAVVVSAPLASAASLLVDIEKAIHKAHLGGAVVGVSVRDCASNKELVNMHGEDHFIPASNMKLVTTGAALHTLGPDFRFRTELLLDGDRLVFAGDGDPSLADPELLALLEYNGMSGIDVDTFISLWTQPLIDAGINEISEVVVDDRIFDRTLTHPKWPADQLSRHYCAQISGFNFHLNVLHFIPQPSNDLRPLVTFRPHADWIYPRNRATCRRDSSAAHSVSIERHIGRNEFTVYGNVKVRPREPERATVYDMPAFFAQLFAERLQDAGITVASHRIAGEDDEEPATLKAAGAQPIGPVIDSPIATVITRCNQDSVNVYAEALLKRVGNAMTRDPGSWSNGGAIIRHVVHERLPIPLAQHVIISDGSGLSRENRIAPSTMTAWLTSLYNDEQLSDVYVQSLAKADSHEGTLSSRFENADLSGATVYAKTGFINFVSCLSGYVIADDGTARTFSIMVNDLKSPMYRAKEMQEQIVEFIARDMAIKSAAALESVTE